MGHRLKLMIVALMLCAIPAIAQNDVTGQVNHYIPDVMENSSQEYAGGKCTPLVFSGTDTCAASNGTSTTRWLHLGWNEFATGSADGIRSNVNVQRFNPEVFTLIVELDTSAGDAANDSVGLGQALFETTFDTTGNDLIELTMNAVDASFTVGEIVTGSLSGATGKIASITAGTAGDSILFLHGVEGTFDDTPAVDEVEGGTSGATDDIKSGGATTLKGNGARNNDGSSVFCQDGGLTNFASWVSDDIRTVDNSNTTKYTFPLRVLTPGAYLRFNFTGINGEAVKVIWTLKCENPG